MLVEGHLADINDRRDRKTMLSGWHLSIDETPPCPDICVYHDGTLKIYC